jgi:hypothetical protein
LTGQCKFDGNLFCFFLPPAKKEGNPTHIAHIAKAPQAIAETKALAKSAILPNWLLGLFCKITYQIFVIKFS